MLESKTVVNMVAEVAKISRDEIKSKSRALRCSWPRQAAMFWLRNLRGETLSYRQIGVALGGWDHTTVMHAIKAADARWIRDDDSNEFSKMMNELNRRIECLKQPTPPL
jgi:chromosomal replication initiation ATPase DnaA